MKKAWYILFLLFHACGNIGREPSIMASPDSLPRIIDEDTVNVISEEDTVTLSPPISQVKKPAGIYRFVNTIDSIRVEHMIRFYPNQTFHLEEKYKNDSVVTTNGTWAISNGAIWTYRQQLLRARYRWNKNILQYSSPASDKTYAMEQVPDISGNKTWIERRQQGVAFFGVGNEPFWSIEVDQQNNIQFRMAEWNQPVEFRLTRKTNSPDSVFYSGATKDSILITLTILPYFCSDGMSDFVYPKKIRVNYNQQEFSGCGMLYK
jgi:uncharacterized membrane protein